MQTTIGLKELFEKEKGYIVIVEGDNDLYNYKGFVKRLKKDYPNRFIFLNNIYENPKALLELRDKEIAVFMVQSTGVHMQDGKIPYLKDFYKNVVKGKEPKHIVSLFSDFNFPLRDLFPNTKYWVKEYKDQNNYLFLESA